MYFQRFTLDDQEELLVEIEKTRLKLAKARSEGDAIQSLALVPGLCCMLTTARQENEAHQLLLEHLPLARQRNMPEELGWLLLALAAANQYLEHRSEATEQFSEALTLAHSISTLKSIP
jgi:hypothetical protein